MRWRNDAITAHTHLTTYAGPGPGSVMPITLCWIVGHHRDMQNFPRPQGFPEEEMPGRPLHLC